MSNPLVEHAPSDEGALTNMDGIAAQTVGTGIFGDVVVTAQDAEEGGFTLAADLALDGLDLLGLAMDPLGTLAGAGIGWLIEHISFLNDGLDLLAGDPAEVQAKATTWKNISESLSMSASDYQDASEKLKPSWDANSAQGYQTSAEGYHASLKAVSSQADGASSFMQTAASVVGAKRGLIRDTVSVFVGDMIVKAGVALGLSWCSFGTSVAAFITDAVIEGTTTAGRIAARIGRLGRKLAELADKIAKEAPKLAKLAKALKQGAGKLEAAGKSASKSIGRSGGKLRANPDSVTDALNKANDSQALKQGVYNAQSLGQQSAPESSGEQKVAKANEQADPYRWPGPNDGPK